MNKGLRWKETIAGVEAPNLMVVETQLPAGRNQTFATPADIVACLKANPEAAGQVLLALESQYIAGETAATACEHKRQRCENDHAVCRDCGAVNRAVTGIVDWGPPRRGALR